MNRPEDMSVESEFLGEFQILKIYGIIIAAVLLVLLIALIDAWYIRINDYFDPGCVITTLLGFLDFLSDLLFAVHLTMLCMDHDERDTKVIIFTILAYFFIALPMAFSFGQLLRENQREWVHSVYLRNWMETHSYFVYMTSIVTGSAFNTVSLMNCQALKLEVFSMGLTRRQRLKFNTNRIWGIVACEVG